MSRTRHTLLAGCLAVATGAAIVAVPAAAPAAVSTQHVHRAAASRTAATPADNAAVADAQWILQAQLPSGAIATQTDHAQIWPYLGNLAALGLATARKLTGDHAYAVAAWHWLDWYARHEDARSGFVTDYTITNGHAASTGTMDSTDAYAGTFLTAVWASYAATHDRHRLAVLLPGVTGALKAIRRTTDSDGLTWAKPSWHVKYLMDEAETYAGLRAGAGALAVLGHKTASRRALAAAAKMRSAVGALWNPATKSFDWAVHGDGAHQTTRWSILYPDGLEQAWAVAYGLVGGQRAVTIVNELNTFQPNWDRPTDQATFDDGTQTVGYWAVAGWALLRVGQRPAARKAAETIASAADQAKLAWPFTPGDAGELSVLQGASLALLPG